MAALIRRTTAFGDRAIASNHGWSRLLLVDINPERVSYRGSTFTPARRTLSAVTLWRFVVLITVAGWMFDAVWLLTGHTIDPTVLGGSIVAFCALWFLHRPDWVFRPRVRLELSASERRRVHARRSAGPPLSWWYRLSDELHWLDEAAWPGGSSWPQGVPGRTPRTRYLPVQTLIGGLLIIAAGVGLIFLGASTWLAALVGFGLAVTLGGFAASRMIAEAKRQGWGTNLDQ